jgi:hypothetical protein
VLHRLLLDKPGLLDIVIPQRIAVLKDFQRSFAGDVQIKEVVLDLVTSNKLFFELRHRDRSLVFEPRNELALWSIGEIDSFFVKVCLSEVSSIHYR